MKKLFLLGTTPVPLVTEKEAAEILGISVRKLKRIRYAREIEFYRIGVQVLYSRRMLLAFLNKCKQETNCEVGNLPLNKSEGEANTRPSEKIFLVQNITRHQLEKEVARYE